MNAGIFTFGEKWKSTLNMNITTTSSTGHLAMFQMSTAVPPIPSGPATASTTGPVRTTDSRTSASSRTMISVTRICSGLSLKKPRPSGVSQTTLDARMNAPT